jgi:hypothetical protein
MEIDITEMVEGLEIENPKIRGRNAIIVFLAAAGATPSEIARKMGLTSQGVEFILSTPLVDAEVRRMTNEVGRQLIHYRLLGLSNEALSAIVTLMRSADSETVKLRSAQDILDRAKFNRAVKEEADTDVPIRDLVRRLDELDAKEREREELEARTIDAITSSS